MDSKKLKKRKKQASKPKRIFEELNRPVTYILDDVKETIVTENTYKAIPYNVLKTYFYLRECSKTKKANLPLMWQVGLLSLKMHCEVIYCLFFDAA